MMNKTVRRALLGILLVIFVVSAGVAGYKFYQYREGERTYAGAAELMDLPSLPPLPEKTPTPTPTETPETAETPDPTPRPTPTPDPYAELLRNMDFTALNGVNEEVTGWILIPNTPLSYPLLQGSDNEYYLNHTYKKTNSSVGAIFLDYRCNADLSDFNTIIYGHRMSNNAMFAPLRHYKTQSYVDQHPDIYLMRTEGVYRYTVFAAYEGSETGESYRLGLQKAASKQAFLDSALAASLIQSAATPTAEDRVLTLSTCVMGDGAKRMIVQAVLSEFVPAQG
ncbi:MAG: class B sortase [Oscillospiraceae bacterium]